MRTRIVPAIDLIDGRCVRLEKGAFETSAVVGDDPLETAKRFAEMGFSRLHLVDLSGAKSGAPKHLHILEAIASQTTLDIDFSGGLRTKENVASALSAGAKKVVVGSAAVTNSDEVRQWFNTFGGHAIILGADVLDGTVRVHGWTEGTGVSLYEVIERYVDCGIATVMSTDISRDGMLQGPSVELYRDLTLRYPQIQLIASGGVSSAKDVNELAHAGVAEIIVGKALYSGAISLDEVKECVW